MAASCSTDSWHAMGQTMLPACPSAGLCRLQHMARAHHVSQPAASLSFSICLYCTAYQQSCAGGHPLAEALPATEAQRLQAATQAPTTQARAPSPLQTQLSAAAPVTVGPLLVRLLSWLWVGCRVHGGMCRAACVWVDVASLLAAKVHA